MTQGDSAQINSFPYELNIRRSRLILLLTDEDSTLYSLHPCRANRLKKGAANQSIHDSSYAYIHARKGKSGSARGDIVPAKASEIYLDGDSQKMTFHFYQDEKNS